MDSPGNYKRFLTLNSFCRNNRDGERCGDTLHSIFENAKNPDKVIVGLVEQNAPQDAFCLEQYCKKYGLQTIKHKPIRKDMEKILANHEDRAKCPHYYQVRQVSFHDVQAKGPAHSRSLTHQVLGNEEFCLQMDAHTTMTKDWDEHMKQEWKSIGNEFAVLSTIPPGLTDMKDLLPTGSKATRVPRQCWIKFRDNGVPVRALSALER